SVIPGPLRVKSGATGAAPQPRAKRSAQGNDPTNDRITKERIWAGSHTNDGGWAIAFCRYSICADCNRARWTGPSPIQAVGCPVLPEFSAQQVACQVIEHLERRRPDIIGDGNDSDERVRAEVAAALVPIAQAYREAELPAHYLEALEQEIVATVPSRW